MEYLLTYMGCLQLSEAKKEREGKLTMTDLACDIRPDRNNNYVIKGTNALAPYPLDYIVIVTIWSDVTCQIRHG
jgi:hypothetical protein